MAAARVDRALCICTTLEEFDDVHRLAMEHDNFWCTAGVHPDNEGVLEPGVEDLLALAARPRVVAIGETGLDYYRLNGRVVEEMEWQRERFRVHIRAARATALPLVIHTRECVDGHAGHPGARRAGRGAGRLPLLHRDARGGTRGAAMGFMISFSGILTFKNAVELKEVAREVPLERCLIETDSPYLAPVPYRGKTNNPSYVPHTSPLNWPGSRASRWKQWPRRPAAISSSSSAHR